METNCGCFSFPFQQQTNFLKQHSDWSPAENRWNDLNDPPWLNLSKSTNHTEGKSPNPAEPSRARAAQRYVGVSLWKSRGLRWRFFFRTCWSRACLKKQRTVRVLLSVKRVGWLYQGALWESQWEWSRRGNDSRYLLEREQKQTAESRNMIENTDRAQLSRENCFLMVHVFQRREWSSLHIKNFTEFVPLKKSLMLMSEWLCAFHEL